MLLASAGGRKRPTLSSPLLPKRKKKKKEKKETRAAGPWGSADGARGVCCRDRFCCTSSTGVTSVTRFTAAAKCSAALDSRMCKKTLQSLFMKCGPDTGAHGFVMSDITQRCPTAVVEYATFRALPQFAQALQPCSALRQYLHVCTSPSASVFVLMYMRHSGPSSCMPANPPAPSASVFALLY